MLPTSLIPLGIDVNRYPNQEPASCPRTVLTGICSSVETVGQRALYAMRLRGIGHNELDGMIGSKKGYASRLINEPRKPRTDTLSKLAKALDVNYEWLATGEGEAPKAGEPATKKPKAVGDVYPSRAMIRQMAWYALEPAPARDAFEAQEFQGGETIRVEDWRDLFFEIVKQFRSWEASGKPAANFTYDPRAGWQRPPSFAPRESKLPRRGNK